MNKTYSRSPWAAAILAAILSFQAPATRAEMISSDEAAARSPADADRAKVQSFLERANVKEKLQAMGVDGLSAKDRVAAMSEEEVHALAQRIDSLPAGGNLSNSDLIIILLVAILVVIII